MTQKIRCTDCYAEFTEEDIAPDMPGCPKCGTASLPQLVADDVTININWHELRILTIWAENWAHGMEGDNKESCVRTLNCIFRRLEKQHPMKPRLSLSGEVEDLKSMGVDVKMVRGDG